MNNKYYVVIIQNDNTQAVYAYTDFDAALALYHTELAYRGEGRNKTICTILNSIGHEMKTEIWERPVDAGEEE